MLFIFPAYLLTITIVLCIFSNKKDHYKSLPKISVKKTGLIFYSFSRHRIKIDDAKVSQLGDTTYLKKERKIVIIKNIDRITTKSGYLYFQAMGNVTIFCDIGDKYKYFNIRIMSNSFNYEALKQKALVEIIDNLFQQNNAKENDRLVKFIGLLNIKIENDKISIGKNPLRLSYQLVYRLNNKIKKINVKY